MIPFEELVQRVIKQESGGNPTAVSPVGAQGLMQVMPATARDPGFGVKPLADPFDPAENERFGRDYLGAMLSRYDNDPQAALAAYNWGPGNADKWVKGGKDMAALPGETRNYLSNILGSSGSMTLAGGAQQDTPASGRYWEQDPIAEPQAAPAREAAAQSSGWWANDPLYTQEMRSMPGGQPQGQTPRPVGDTTAGGLGFAATARASLPPDVNDQIKRLADSTGIDPRRFGVVDGNIVYADEQGNYQRVTPSVFGGEWYEVPERLARWATSGFGPGIPAAAGMATGAAMGPTGMSIPAAGGAAALADVARQGVDRAMAGESVTDIDLMNSAGQGALAAGGQGLAAGMSRLGARGLAPDVNKLDRPAANALQRKAAQEGIPLTPGEVTNLPSLKGQQKMLGNLPQSSDTMDDFYRSRRGAIESRVGQFLDQMSPVDSPEIAGLGIKETATEALQAARATRQKLAMPVYQEAFAKDTWSPRLQEFLDDPVMKQGLARGMKMLRLEAVAEGKPFNPNALGVDIAEDGSVKLIKVPNMRVLDAAKRGLDDILEQYRDSTTGKLALTPETRALNQFQRAYISELDRLNPKYAQARGIYADQSEGVDFISEGLLGTISRLKPGTAKDAATKLFGPSSGPKVMRLARQELERQNPEAWQAIKRSWIQQQWEKAGREFASTGSEVINQGPKFRALLLGDENRRRMMKEALSLDEWKAINDLSDVLEAAGRVKPLGSDTAWNQEAMRLARENATPAPAKLVRAIRVWDWPKMAENWATERNLAKNAQAMAEIITSPRAIQELKQIKQMSPGSAKFRVALGQLLSRTGFAVTGLDEPADFDAPALQR